MIRRSLALILFAASIVPTAAADRVAMERGDLVAGRASTIDGDTIDIQKKRLRLYGVDAPESSQTCNNASGAPYRCGQAASFYLDDIVQAEQPISCTVVDLDQWGRGIAVCTSSKGRDLSEAMAAAGHAIAFRRYSKDYIPVEARAREQKLNLWAGTFQDPVDFRRDEKARKAEKSRARNQPSMAEQAAGWVRGLW